MSGGHVLIRHNDGDGETTPERPGAVLRPGGRPEGRLQMDERRYLGAPDGSRRSSAIA